MDTLSAQVREVMVRASKEAILPHYRSLGDGDIEAKSPGDVVTIADHRSEAILGEGLASIMPEAAIVGEEGAEAEPEILDRLEQELCWIIDPLDGTNNFAVAKPPFGILVALCEGGDTLAGWIYDCLSGRFCHAARSKGAFIDGEPISSRASGKSPPVAAISLIFADQAERAFLMEHIAPHYEMVDIPRCAAEQYPRLALGENDISLFNRTLPWDHAAPALWLNEAGGRVARFDGSAFRPGDWNRPGLLGASTPELWEIAAARLAAMAGP